MLFSLMNKDNIVFNFKTEKSIAGTIYTPISQLLSVLPIDFTNLQDWIKSRYVLNYRYSIDLLFKKIGIENIEDIISITNCVSLNDTFWIKPIDSKVTWASVSPYRNSLNEIIARYSFDGTLDGKNITSSPDFSTDGTFPKCWKRYNGKIYMYKAGTSGAFNAGNEPYSEVFAYQLASYLGINSLEYKLGKHKGVDVSVCELMCTEDIGLKSFRDCYKATNVDYAWLKKVHPSIFYMLVDTFILDILTCNIDRHMGNVGFLVNNDTQQIIGLSKIYDNNLSCIPYYTTSDNNLSAYLLSLRAKDGSIFKQLFNLIDSPYVREKFRHALSFEFKPLGNKRADSRVSILNKMLKFQIGLCLGG